MKDIESKKKSLARSIPPKKIEGGPMSIEKIRAFMDVKIIGNKTQKYGSRRENLCRICPDR
jgi:hypothetical protein